MAYLARRGQSARDCNYRGGLTPQYDIKFNNDDMENCIMRKPDLAAVIADKADISKDKAAEVLNALLSQVTTAVSKGESVSLIGFGSFERRSRAARTGKNPQTGAAIQIAASNTVAFKPGKALKEAINK